MRKIFIYNSFSNIMLELVVWMIYLHQFGWSMAEIAFLQGLFTFFSAVFELPSGIVADRMGKKRALQLGEIICILYLISYFFPHQHMIVYSGFICFSIGLALISGTDTSLLYNLVEKDNFLKYMGYFNAIGVISVAIGNLIGGWLADVSWGLLFITSILCRLISLSSITLLKVPESINSDDVQENGIATLKLHIKLLYDYTKKNSKFKYLLFASAFLISSVTLSYQYVSILLSGLEMGTGKISTIYGAISILGSLLAFLSERITKKISVKVTAVLVFLITVVSFASIGFFSNMLPIIILSFMVPNILFELLSVILDSKVHKELIDTIRVSSVSLINLINSLLLTVGSFIISKLSNLLSLATIISLICTITILISLFAYVKYERETNNEQQ
ncbi:MFS transporter [Streptococcus halichoeri]|uniref:MFS transporter n=1 Tax=Streptococcus halichoeri TaxID=254785 RepID=UPI001356F25D|nr:MFS transporter [Streptococcus halichoeri]